MGSNFSDNFRDDFSVEESEATCENLGFEYLDLAIMGSATSASKKKTLTSKLDTAGKTGVLNLSDQELKPSSSVWPRLTHDGLNLKLKNIDISGNILKAIPVELYMMANLKVFHASRCNIQRIADMSGLARLGVIELDQNDLEIDSLKPFPSSVQKVNLAGNHLSAFPPIMRGLNQIVELNLAGNRIETIFGIGTLTGLIVLILDDNLLVEVSTDASQLIKLQKISLKNNRMSKQAISFDGQSIPAAFFTSTAVESMELSGNPSLGKTDILAFEGIESVIERRKRAKDKNFQGGAMTDMSLFGLD